MITFQEQLLTIPSDLSLIKMDKDPYYRYKMPELKLSYQNKYTKLTNLNIVAKHLQILPEYILEHFSIQFKTPYQKQVFKKRTQIKLKGCFMKQKLQKQLDKFIVNHLICKQCLYPQLRYHNDSTKLKASCKSCGYLQICDPNENKIKNFIYKNPIKKSQDELKEQEDELIYGNRQIQYESCQSEDYQ